MAINKTKLTNFYHGIIQARCDRNIAYVEDDDLCFAPVVLSDVGHDAAVPSISEQSNKGDATKAVPVEIVTGNIIIRLDGGTGAVRIAEIVWAIGSRS